MSPEAKQVLIRGGYLAATLALGALGGHAVSQSSAPAQTAKAVPVICACECKTPKPDPIKVEIKVPK
jgi:hypothetical protein